MNDDLTPGIFLPVLKTRYMGREYKYFHSIDSTNNEARKAAISGGSEGLVIAAETQTSGRGRLGRSWVTPEYTSIAFSLILKPDMKPCDSAGLALVMGTAVCRALRKAAHLDAGVKWPNDIIVSGKKVCGILTEMDAYGDHINYIVAGVGINVNVDKFPDDLKDKASSIKLEAGRSIPRYVVLASVLMEFEVLYGCFKSKGFGSIVDEFKSMSVTLGKDVSVSSASERFEGRAVDITADGLLVVRLNDGSERKVISGDVSVRGVNGYL